MDTGDRNVLILEAAHHVREAWEALQVLVEEGLLPSEMWPYYELLGAVDTSLTAYTQRQEQEPTRTV